MKTYSKKAQSILEYTLLLGAIIAIIVAVLLSEGGIKSKVRSTYDTFGNTVSNATSDLTTGVFQ